MTAADLVKLGVPAVLAELLAAKFAELEGRIEALENAP